jgi:hypothetical protein
MLQPECSVEANPDSAGSAVVIYLWICDTLLTQSYTDANRTVHNIIITVGAYLLDIRVVSAVHELLQCTGTV